MIRAGPGILLLISSFLWMPFQQDIEFHMTSEKIWLLLHVNLYY